MNDEMPETTNEETTAPDRQELLNEIGNKLSSAREALGESVDEPARILKLSRSHLLALESGDWNNLPDEVYALGFLRQYSSYLKVDVGHELEQLKNDQYQLTRPLTFPDPAVAPSKKWAWIAGIAFVLLFILFNVMSSNKSEFAPTEEPPEMAESATETMQAELPAQSEMEAIATTASEPESAAMDSKIEAELPDASTAQPATSPAAVSMHSYRFEAIDGDVWMQIFSPDSSGANRGELLRETLLKQGQHAIVETAAESLWITCGNAPALGISVDGRVMAEAGSLGSGKRVLRNHRLNIR